MTYNPNIPNATDRPSQSQDQLKTNFQQLNFVFEEDHVPFDAAIIGDRGKHKFVTLQRQPIDNITNGNDTSLYAKLAGGISQLFWRYQNNGTVVQLSISQAPIPNQNGYTWLPGGMMLQWGLEVGATNTNTISFNIPFSGDAYNVQLTSNRNTNTGISVIVKQGSVDANGFIYLSDATGPHNLYWMAIGPFS